eukprot:7719171-Pyramimonas_sp.AAC.1
MISRPPESLTRTEVPARQRGLRDALEPISAIAAASVVPNWLAALRASMHAFAHPQRFASQCE